MKRALVIIAVLALFSSCCARRVVLNDTKVDSVKIVREIEYIERWRDTTIYISLPAERWSGATAPASKRRSPAPRQL